MIVVNRQGKSVGTGVIKCLKQIATGRSEEQEDTFYFKIEMTTVQMETTKRAMSVGATWRTSALPASLPFIHAISVLIVETS